MADKADAELKAKSLDELRAMLDDDSEEDED